MSCADSLQKKKRFNANKKRVKEDYNAAKTDLQHSINTLFDEHEEES